MKVGGGMDLFKINIEIKKNIFYGKKMILIIDFFFFKF